MAFVVDASVTMSWCVADEADALSIAALDRCRTDSAVVVPGRWALGVVTLPLVAAGSLRP